MGRWRRLGEREMLDISAPTSAEQFVRSFKFTVIVICKHGFTAENKYELTTHKGDILKVLERPGNGWLLVQFLDTVNKYGLIPAKYVDIAVNDPLILLHCCGYIKLIKYLRLTANYITRLKI